MVHKRSMADKQFPHINRKLTAGLLITSFMFLGILNLMQNVLFKVNEGKRLRSLLMQNPGISSLHEKLGQYYLGRDMERAKNEYLLAQEYFVPSTNPNPSNVLGSISNPWQNWLSIEAKIQNTDREIEYWQKVSQTYPDYLYAYLKLSVLNWQKGERDNAKNYLSFILIKDPTDKNALKLLGDLK